MIKSLSLATALVISLLVRLHAGPVSLEPGEAQVEGAADPQALVAAVVSEGYAAVVS